MANKRPSVIITRRLPDVIETRMMELFDCHLNETDTPMNHGALVEAMQNCEVLVPTVTDRIDAAAMTFKIA